MKEIRLLPEVLEDAVEAVRWYDEEGYAGLGERFLEAFHSGLDDIRSNGEIHRPVYNDFRRILLKPFPFNIYYAYHQDLIIVPLLIHAARNPHLVNALLKKRRSMLNG